MNTHQEWLRQLQSQQSKRQNDGKLTEGEKNVLHLSSRQESNSISIMQAMSATGIPVNEKTEQLDELPFLLPLGLAAGKMLAWGAAKKAAGALGRGALRVAGKAATALGGGQQESISDRLELERIMEVVSYKLIEELEDSLGKRLNPEEIEEFVHNNYNKIMAEANNQVTAHAVPGDLRKGVGATAPVVPKGNVGTLKAKASRFNPRRGGSDY
jgi:succinate dehydrogenase/fumarate reductase flavoprotein subunit